MLNKYPTATPKRLNVLMASNTIVTIGRILFKILTFKNNSEIKSITKICTEIIIMQLKELKIKKVLPFTLLVAFLI